MYCGIFDEFGTLMKLPMYVQWSTKQWSTIEQNKAKSIAANEDNIMNIRIDKNWKIQDLEKYIVTLGFVTLNDRLPNFKTDLFSN